MKTRRAKNIVLQILTGLNNYELLATCSKYNSVHISHIRKYYQADTVDCFMILWIFDSLHILTSLYNVHFIRYVYI